MRRTRITPNVTRSTKLRGAQHSLELAFRSKDFRVSENLIFPVLTRVLCMAILNKYASKLHLYIHTLHILQFGNTAFTALFALKCAKSFKSIYQKSSGSLTISSETRIKS